MKPRFRWAVWLVALLVPVVALADTDRALSVDDVLRLHFAGVSEEIILSEIIVTESIFDLSVDEILRLKEAGISERLLQFMVDTGRPSENESEYSEDDPEYDVDDEEWYAEDEGEIWVNEIEEIEPTTTYHVSLNYSYRNWWYDSYWWDYWYYDYHYYPYQTSYVYHIGGWYPGWYTYRYCWSPAYWGYRTHWYGHHGYWTAYHHRAHQYPSHHYVNDYYRSRSGHRYPSETKFKTGSQGAGQPLLAGGIKTRDATKLRVSKGRLADPVRGTKTRGVVLADGAKPPTKRPVRAPVKSVRTESLRDPDGPGGRKTVRGVRAPATSGRPVKVRTIRRPTESVRSPARPDSPTRPVREVKMAPDEASPPADAVRPDPARPQKEKSKAVQPAPRTPSRPPKVSAPSPTRVSPAPKTSSKPSRPSSKSPPKASRPPSRTKKPRGR